MSKNFELLVRSQGHAEVLPPGRLSPEPPLERFSYDRLPLSHREPSDWERVSHILKKRWKPAMGFAMATFLAVAVATFMMKPRGHVSEKRTKFHVPHRPIAVSANVDGQSFGGRCL